MASGSSAPKIPAWWNFKHGFRGYNPCSEKAQVWFVLCLKESMVLHDLLQVYTLYLYVSNNSTWNSKKKKRN